MIENITIKHNNAGALGSGLGHHPPEIKGVKQKKGGAGQYQIPGAVVFIIAIYRLTWRADPAITLQELVTEA